MKWKLVAQTVALINSLFGTKELPIDAENKQLNLSAEQRQKIVDALGEENAEKAINGINSEIKAMTDTNLLLKAAQDELDALVLESGLTAEELASAANEGEGNENVLAIVKKVAAKNKEMASNIAKLMNEPEGDRPQEVIGGRKGNMTHSATHLFGSGKSYDAFEGGRSWNARLRDGNVVATDFNKNAAIPTLQKDMDHFVEENNGLLTSLFNDFYELPAEWDRRTGVVDMVSDGYIMPAEIVQGRANGWSPKNKFKIESEKGRVFRKKIDITFSGFQLQEIENTWIRSYNANDGSQPWKMSFIGFLLGEIIKRQKLDDRNAQINGIFVQSPDGDDMPGAAVNSQDGLLYLWYYHRDVTKKYRAFDIGAPTESNIVDYIEQMIMMMPEIERKEQGLEIQLSTKWLKAYKKRAGEIEAPLNKNLISGEYLYKKNHPIDYPNFIFQELKDATKTDFIGITQSNNVQILDYLVDEKGKFTTTHEKRDTHIFADYRLGIRIKFVGTKLAAGDPREFEMQKVWSNNVPVFSSEVYAPAFDIDNSGIVKITYPNIAIDAGWKTNITSIEGATPGSIVRIKGNTGLAGAKNLVDGGTLDLASNFDLSSGGTITLFVKADGTFKELSRTTAPDVAATTDIEFTGATLDSKGGTVFRFEGGANTTIASIINGVEGKTITIYGRATYTLTIADVANNIDVASTAVLADAVSYVQLTFVDGVWMETGRSITA